MTTAEQQVQQLAHAINNLCLALDGVEFADTEQQKAVAALGVDQSRREAVGLLDLFGLLTDTPRLTDQKK